MRKIFSIGFLKLRYTAMLFLMFQLQIMVSCGYFKLERHLKKNSIFTLFMTKVFDILLDPYNGLQMPRSQLQIRLQESSIDYKNKFPKISERMEK